MGDLQERQDRLVLEVKRDSLVAQVQLDKQDPGDRMVHQEQQGSLEQPDNQDLLGRLGQGVNRASQDKTDSQGLGARQGLRDHQDPKDNPDL